MKIQIKNMAVKTKSKSLRVAYTTLMVEICPASPDISLREMAESSLKIDPHNANPFIVLVYRLIDERVHQQNPLVEEMAARISKIDPTSPYAPYIFIHYSLFFYIFIAE